MSRYVAFRLKQFIKENSDIFLVSDEYETHYATAYVCDDFMIIINTDDYWKGADLNRVKLGLEIKGITILLKKIELIGYDGIFKYMYTIQRKAYKILSALKITNIQRFDYQG